MEILHTQDKIQTQIENRKLITGFAIRRSLLPATSLSLLLGFLLMLSSCTVPGGNQKVSRIRLSIQNTLPIHRKNVPIVLTGEQLRKVNPDFSFKAYSVVTGKAPREVMIAAQADDLDYDGERDQLCFLLDFEKEETKEISILYDPNVKATLTLDINKQTRAGIFPELNAVAAMESNLIAYLLKPDGAVIAYGKKRAALFSVDSMFQGELDYNQPLSPEFRLHFDSHNISLSQQVEIEVEKPEHQWTIRDLENQETYFIRASQYQKPASTTPEAGQLNISKSIGLSLNALVETDSSGMMVALTPQEGLIGCGGVALQHQETAEILPLPNEGDYVRILADGATRSIVQRTLPKWHIKGETLQFTSTTFIYGENPWIEQHIHIDGNLPTDYAIVVGIPNLSEAYGTDEKQGWFWSWGTDPSGIAPLGVALIYPTTQGGREIKTDTSRLSITLTPDAAGHFSYRAFAIWGDGIDGMHSETEFAQHVQTTTTAMNTPLRIKFLPPEDEK